MAEKIRTVKPWHTDIVLQKGGELMSDYNYPVFDLPAEMKPFELFSDAPNAGQKAPSYPLEDLETGETVEMRSLWKKSFVIVEFGSFT
jgi:hypothetical protein